MTMIVINIYEAKAKLSEFLELVARGEQVVICKRNRPIAELRAVPAVRQQARPIGLGAGRVTVPDSFFDALPADVIEGFEGEVASAEADEDGRRGGRQSRVAENEPDSRVHARPRTRSRRRK